MAAVITRIKSLPPNAQLTAQIMKMVGFDEGTWEYHPNHDLADMSRTLQPRGIAGTATKSKIEHYKVVLKPYTLLRSELLMPPVVFAQDFLLDGNTRTLAAYALEWMTFPAFVLKFAYESDTPKQLLDQMFELAAVLNLGHGDNLDKKSTENAIARLITPDTNAADLAKRLGVARGTVSDVMYAREARLQAERLGLDYEAPHMSRSHMANLGRAHYDDAVFTEFLALLLKGKLSTNEQSSLGKRLLSETTEARKVKLLPRLQAAYLTR